MDRRRKSVYIIYIVIAVIVIAILYFTGRGEKGGEKKYEYLPVYGVSAETGGAEVNFYIKVAEDSSIKNKLNRLAEGLSRYKFNLPVNLVEIEKRGEGNVAVINLRENPWNRDMKGPPELSGVAGLTWKYNYFQGSTGAGNTSITLRKTILQPEYEGDWIDGVIFLYEGEKIKKESWDHLELSGIFFRK